jgi:hypothetical protein
MQSLIEVLFAPKNHISSCYNVAVSYALSCVTYVSPSTPHPGGEDRGGDEKLGGEEGLIK